MSVPTARELLDTMPTPRDGPWAELFARVEKVLALLDDASPVLNHPAVMRFAALVRQRLDGEEA